MAADAASEENFTGYTSKLDIDGRVGIAVREPRHIWRVIRIDVVIPEASEFSI